MGIHREIGEEEEHYDEHFSSLLCGWRACFRRYNNIPSGEQMYTLVYRLYTYAHSKEEDPCLMLCTYSFRSLSSSYANPSGNMTSPLRNAALEKSYKQVHIVFDEYHIEFRYK